MIQRFPKGARVCFIGDSLTATNQILPRVIDAYNRNFPKDEIWFFNCGTSGGTCKKAFAYLEEDVLSHAPTHAVVAFAVNDADRWCLDWERSADKWERLRNAFEDYQKQIDGYCRLLQAHGISPILCTPAPYDEYTKTEEPAFRGGYALLLAYADFLRAYAKEHSIPLCDYHAYMAQLLQTDETPLYSPDHVHPTEHGYYQMAKCFLAQQGIEIGAEMPIPDCFTEWAKAVARMRNIFGAEQMLLPGYAAPTEEKVALMEEKVRNRDWGAPVFERFIRGYAADKRGQKELYQEIDRLYERDIVGRNRED